MDESEKAKFWADQHLSTAGPGRAALASQKVRALAELLSINTALLSADERAEVEAEKRRWLGLLDS